MDRPSEPELPAGWVEGNEFPGEAPGVEEVPAIAWPLLLRARVHHHLRRRDHYPRWVLVTVLTGLFAMGFTITIVAVSLGPIGRDLGASPSALTWGVTGPWLALALTACAWDGGSFIAARIIGSLPGAAIGPTSMALIMRAFPDEDRVKAMGWWALVGAGGPVIGLVAGGPMVEAFGWRALFLAQVPLALFALIVAIFVLHETPRRSSESIDVAGALTIGLATVAALLALTFGAELGWTHPVVLGLFAIAPAMLWAFVRCERRAEHPLLPLDFFRHRDFTASLVAQFGANSV